MSALVNAQDELPANWLREKICGFSSGVTSIVPSGYEAYSRLLHPAYSVESGKKIPVPWQSLSSGVRFSIDKTSQWENISAHLEGQVSLHYDTPLEGSLEADIYKKLIAVLKAHTSFPEKVWFGVWTGYESVCEAYKTAPKFSLASRDYYLLSGGLSQSIGSLCDSPFYQSANIFWPEDRAWCVGSDIDLKSTYIASSQQVVCELSAEFAGEIFQVDPRDPITLRTPLS